MLQYNIVIDKREIHLDFTASPKGHSTTTCIKLLFHRLKIQPLHGVTVYYQYHLLFLLFLPFLVFVLYCFRFVLFRFVFCFHALVGAFGRCSFDLFLSSRPRIGLATTYITNAGKRGPGGKEKEWTDCVADDLRLFGVTGDWKTAALDPGAWYNTVQEGGCRFMAAWVREEENASNQRQKKRDAEEADKVEVTPGVTVASLRRFRTALIGPTQGLPKRRRLCH